MKIEEFLNYRKELLDASKDEDGFVQQNLLLSQVLPLMVDAKLLDSEDWNDCYYLNTAENFKVNGYTVNESSERLQLFIVDEASIDLTSSEKDLQISAKSYYDNQFKRVAKFLNKAIKGYLSDAVQDADPIRTLINQLSNSTGLDQFDVFEIFLISTTATVETRGALPQPKRIDFEDEEITVNFIRNRERVKKDVLIIKKLIDLNLLFDVVISQGNREPLVVDFEKLFDKKIEILKAADEDKFESYLCVMPAQILSELYKRYSSRLLEKNVRSFLQFKGANKEIRETIRKNPEKFIAFNNGITITATSKEVEAIAGRLYIKSLTDFQIVNGGQTTATIYFTHKDGFSIDKVRVMAKINVALDVSEEGLNQLISDISRYSNTQTKVSSVDLSSRSPELNKIKSLSESIITPSGRKWFFEKARGEFNTKLRIAGSNKGRVEKEFPKEYRFNKEQLGKYYTAWGEQPYVVKKGGEKVFRYFLENVSGDSRSKNDSLINRKFYESLISKVILFTQFEKIYGQGKYAIGQIRSAVVPYSLSILYLYTDGSNSNISFDMSRIWKGEKLDDDLKQYAYDLMVLMNDLIKKYSESDDFGEYSKNKKLWDKISVSVEVKEFMNSVASNLILKKYTIVGSLVNKINSREVDFEEANMMVGIYCRGINFYQQLKNNYSQIKDIELKKIDSIISAIIKEDDLSKDLLAFENNFLSQVRRSNPELFDQIDSEYNYKVESTLRFIILKYNQAIEKGIDIKEYFISIINSKIKGEPFPIFNKIASNLADGKSPSLKDVIQASSYFNINKDERSESVKNQSIAISLQVLKKMVEWDSRMKLLSNAERSYVADFAYELKPLNSFHKSNLERHLRTLIKAGFTL